MTNSHFAALLQAAPAASLNPFSTSSITASPLDVVISEIACSVVIVAPFDQANSKATSPSHIPKLSA
ncbi:MAG: hypothetical protein KC441_03775 [Anaerolineales bacterium]|nr:hypothetical protein [Anaerolineales bacterium]